MLITKEMLYNLYIVILGTTVNITINLYYIKVSNNTKGLKPSDKESAQGIACVFYLKIRLGKDNHGEYECIDVCTRIVMGLPVGALSGAADSCSVSATPGDVSSSTAGGV